MLFFSSTVEEVWDHDPEARLSACCVQERIRQLTTLDPLAKNTSLSLQNVTGVNQLPTAGLRSSAIEESEHLLAPSTDASTSSDYSGSSGSTLPLVAVRGCDMYSYSTTSGSDDLPPKESSIS